MVIKKVKNTHDDTAESVVSTPDLEEKRHQFQRTAKNGTDGVVADATPKVSSRRKRTIAIVAGFLLLVGVVIVTIFYFTWLNSSEKIVADALTNAASSHSVMYSADVTSKGGTVAQIKGEYTDGKSSMNGTIHTSLPGDLAKINASVVTTQSDLYIKLSNATKLVSRTAPASQQRIFDIILPLLQKQIDDQWIQMSPSDIAILQPATKLSSCSTDGIKQLTTDQQMRMALIRLYIANPFMSVDEVDQQGNIGTYELSIQRDVLNKFLDELQKSETVSAVIAGCGDEINKIKQSDVSKIKAKLSINKTDRTITKAVFSVDGSMPLAIAITPTFNQSVDIKEPEANLRFDEIKSKLYGAFTGLQSN